MTREIDDLLPLYAAGTASRPERARVEAARRDEPSLEEDPRFWRRLGDEVAADA